MGRIIIHDVHNEILNNLFKIFSETNFLKKKNKSLKIEYEKDKLNRRKL